MAESSGGCRMADADEVQQGGRYVARPGADGKLHAVPRSDLARYRAAVDLTPPPPMSLAEEEELERRRMIAGGWLTPPLERMMLEDGRGDPAAEMTRGW
jgi:hypothetical protein